MLIIQYVLGCENEPTAVSSSFPFTQISVHLVDILNADPEFYTFCEDLLVYRI